MEFMKTVPRPTTRLKRGNVLLANAQGVDTKPVKARLNAFVEIHRRYLTKSLLEEHDLYATLFTPPRSSPKKAKAADTPSSGTEEKPVEPTTSVATTPTPQAATA
jgi:hypothetical protein